MEYAIEFNRLVKLEMEGRSDDRAEGAEGAVAASPPLGPTAQVRQAPTDLTLSFVDEATAEGRCRRRGPDWLLADRLAACADFELPIGRTGLVHAVS